MGISDLLAMADDKLHELFQSKPHDPTRARDKVVKQIDRTKVQFGDKSSKGKKWFRHANGVVELTLPFAIDGKQTFYLHTNKFEAFLDGLKSEVTSGSLDKEINEPVEPTARAARVSSGKGWTDERRARFKATMAAKKK